MKSERRKTTRRLELDSDIGFRAWMQGIDPSMFRSLKKLARKSGVTVAVYLRERLGFNLGPLPVVRRLIDPLQVLSDPTVSTRAYELMADETAVRYEAETAIFEDWQDVAKGLNRMQDVISKHYGDLDVSLVQFQRLGGGRRGTFLFLMLFRIDPVVTNLRWDYYVHRTVVRSWSQVGAALTWFTAQMGPDAQLVHFNRIGNASLSSRAIAVRKKNGHFGPGLELIAVFRRRVPKNTPRKTLKQIQQESENFLDSYKGERVRLIAKGAKV